MEGCVISRQDTARTGVRGLTCRNGRELWSHRDPVTGRALDWRRSSVAFCRKTETFPGMPELSGRWGGGVNLVCEFSGPCQCLSLI